MLVAERQQKIIELLKEHKSVRVTELSNMFSVTEETIRRDLEKLEKEDKLSRIHGGALAKKEMERREIPHFEREITNIDEKKEIALLAAKQINEHDTVILDASSTALYMAKILENMPMTVLTNSINVSLELSVKQEITVISSGGTLLSKSLSFAGPLAETSLDNYHVNKAFISCHSFHADYGISDSNELQARVKKKMIERAEKSYIMVDHTKIGRKSFSYIDNVESIDYVITDKYVTKDMHRQIAHKSIPIIQNKI